MALAEARAVWQRTANRCLAQEDAKRAPKLACCSSVPPSVKQADTGLASAPGGEDLPSTISVPFNLSSSYSCLSPRSKWWLSTQPSYSYQKRLMDEHFDSVEDHGKVDDSSCQNMCSGKAIGEMKEFGIKEEDESRIFSSWNCVDTLRLEVKESSWIEVDKNTPWWRTADTDELASLLAQRSLDPIENCDLPRPQITHVKKAVDNTCFARDGISSSLLDSKLSVGSHHHYNSHLHTAGSQKVEGEAVSSTDKRIRDIPTHEKMLETHTFENDPTKAQLMEALRHSQTRAREAERAAKQACAEKEDIVKLVFRQASQLFAYKQWLQLLQLESMYLQFVNNTNQSMSGVFPQMLPWTPRRTRKLRKDEAASCKKGTKKCCPDYDASKFAVVLALGLGLAGAGFLLGWTIGLMLPTW